MQTTHAGSDLLQLVGGAPAAEVEVLVRAAQLRVPREAEELVDPAAQTTADASAAKAPEHLSARSGESAGC